MSRKSTKAARVEKPRPDFPLFPHASGRWAKKVLGAFCYFGKTADDPTGQRALDLWLDQKDALLAGRKPRKADDPGGVTVKELCDRFLGAKEDRVQTGELTQRSFDDYHATALRVADQFGRRRLVADLEPQDFADLRRSLGKRYGPVTLGNEITRIRTLFKWGFDSTLLASSVRYGESFQRPSKKTLRLARIEAGPKFFEAEQIREIIGAAALPLEAMVLLGVNCALGNSDCARLRFDHFNLDSGWLDFPRPKTGVARRCPLWTETIAALKRAIAKRPEPRESAYADLVFLTRYRRPWRDDVKRNNPISVEFAKVLDDLGIPRNGGFYSLRHVVETIGGEVRDQPALNLIMGHAAHASDMGHRYRERIGDDRLQAISDHVRNWLFPPAPKKVKPR